MTIRFTLMERIVGLFILIAILAFLSTLVMVGQGKNWFRKHNTYYATYKEGYNLQPGAKVQMLRTDIGQVTGVELTADNKVMVTMRILADYASRIRTDSKAAIASPTLIGSEYINLVPGSRSAPVISPGSEIPAKEKKSISEYIDDLNLEHKLLRFDEILESVSTIADRLTRPDGELFGTLNNVERTTKNVSRITADIAGGKGNLGRIIQSEEIYNRIISELEAVDRILATVHSATKSVEVLTKSATGVTGGVSKGVPNIMTQIKAILDRVENVTKQLEKTMNEVPEISHDARLGIRQVNEILDSVKKNFLIKANLPPQPVPETHGLQIRGE